MIARKFFQKGLRFALERRFSRFCGCEQCDSIYSGPLECCPLSSKSLIRVAGPDAASLLQGLITNDVQHVREGRASYSLVLNAQGRVLHDIVIYNNSAADLVPQKEDYLVEVHSESCDDLVRHLKKYRLRKKVDINEINERKLWAIFESNVNFVCSNKVNSECMYANSKVDKMHALDFKNVTKNFIVSRDPRLSYLGYKLILPHNVHPNEVINSIEEINLGSYTKIRYQLGVGEGPSELPVGGVTPLEANGDFLHGISFHKGCYLGQELTARVHHTGVVRKRYMPILFKDCDNVYLPEKPIVVDGSGKKVGKVICYLEKYGLALLRVSDCLAEGVTLSVDNHRFTTFRPVWWPFEASKLRPSLTR